MRKHAPAQAVLAMSASALSMRDHGDNVKEIKADNRAFVPPPELLERGPSGYRKNRTNDCPTKYPKTTEDNRRLEAANVKRKRQDERRFADRAATFARLRRADNNQGKAE